MARKPSVNTQLKNALEKVAALTETVQCRDKDIDLYCREKRLLKEEIEQIHQFLDAVPNSVSRKSESAEAWAVTERKAITRLTAWLASNHSQ